VTARLRLPVHLYHGTPQLVERIEPRLARGLTSRKDRLCAVYASHERAYATAFALPIVPDGRGKLRWSLACTDHTPRITIHAGRLDLSRVGYLYRVPPGDFVQLDEFQWVSYSPVLPLEYSVVDPTEYVQWVASPRAAHGGRIEAKGGASDIEFDRLWEHVVSESPGSAFTIHGPDHWRRVERNALRLATRTGADVAVARLFALFHDSCRENESRDDGHGARGAELAERLRGVLFDLTDEQLDQLRFACVSHTDGLCHDDPTIGTCWDADRLDLERVGVTPDPRFMSTAFGRELANRRASEARTTSATAANGTERDWLTNYGSF
jgi:uncharacterized protein